jgi:hypothetical protein
MNFRLIPYKHLLAALAVGLALRLFFVYHFPFQAGDSHFYDELARNWLDRGVYGFFDHGQLMPADVRMPGYPAFLAAIYAVLGRTVRTVMFVQVFVDLMTCFLVAMIAARFANARRKKSVATVAIWMAALCLFTANYTAVELTEVLAIFFTAAAVLFFLNLLSDPSMDLPLDPNNKRAVLSFVGRWLLGGFLVGLGTLVRPDAPILLAAVGLVLCFRWWRIANWRKLALAGLWTVVGLLFALMPWAIRNARTMGNVAFLSPRYAETRGDFIPRGFYSWTQTWMVRFGDSYLVTWKVRSGPIRMEELSQSAFDSDAEKSRVELVLNSYNKNYQMTPVMDRVFADLAAERTSRHPMRTYVHVPVMRTVAMWFTPRIELLPYSGKLSPPGERWRGNPADFGFTVAYGVVNIIYLALAAVGVWKSWRHPALPFMIAFIIIRTAVMTQMPTVEPRYVIECYPVIIAFGALVWNGQRSPEAAAKA